MQKEEAADSLRAHRSTTQLPHSSTAISTIARSTATGNCITMDRGLSRPATLPYRSGQYSVRSWPATAHRSPYAPRSGARRVVPVCCGPHDHPYETTREVDKTVRRDLQLSNHRSSTPTSLLKPVPAEFLIHLAQVVVSHGIHHDVSLEEPGAHLAIGAAQLMLPRDVR